MSKEEKDLFYALETQDLAQTKTLLKKVQNINVQTQIADIYTENSILHYIVKNACNDPESGWIELLEEVLLKYRANNSTPVHNSIADPCSIISIIDVNIKGQCGTPLRDACILGNLDVVNVLLRHGADPNVYKKGDFAPLCEALEYALKTGKNDIAKALFAHGAKVDNSTGLIITAHITEYSQSTIETFLPYTCNFFKNKMLESIVESNCAETDHDIKIAELLLKPGADPETVQSTLAFSVTLRLARSKGKSKLEKLFTEHKENVINNNSHPKQGVQPPIIGNTKHNSPQKQSLGISPQHTNNHFQPTLRSGVQSAQPHIAGNTKHNSPQKQSSGRSWIIISSALLFGAIGATLAAMGIIPKIVAIGVIATVVLSGIAGAIVGGVAGYLVDVAINQCHGNTVNQQCAAQ
ncbi:ankyrin repeat domain-containing protein [Wolbachia endosymbiont (group A) of Bibio marci]|uniref:ankyrin repeat domain-containing protein n=1 Tax=Wolbachia endosymbiont (group A) of Bibio marci TaxID=2953987 RepID=UPI0022322217|nr:ankyrin repeat domain-containing protein [Wolbachia endosymbiont (group A) of Bibio marci]